MQITNKKRVNEILANIEKSDWDYVTSEDFRMGLGEYCPGLFQHVAADLKIKCAELTSMLEEGTFHKDDLSRIMKEFDKSANQ